MDQNNKDPEQVQVQVGTIPKVQQVQIADKAHKEEAREYGQQGLQHLRLTKPPKHRPPPSIERLNPPPKKLNMETNASQSCNSPRIDDITRRNISQAKDTKKSGTRSNSSTMETYNHS